MKVYNSVKAWELLGTGVEGSPCVEGIEYRVTHEEFCSRGHDTPEGAADAIASHIAVLLAGAHARSYAERKSVLFFNRIGPSIEKMEDGKYRARWRGKIVVTNQEFDEGNNNAD